MWWYLGEIYSFYLYISGKMLAKYHASRQRNLLPIVIPWLYMKKNFYGPIPLQLRYHFSRGLQSRNITNIFVLYCLYDTYYLLNYI